MRFGLALPHYDFSRSDGGPVTWESLATVARRAEALGFDSVWLSDHFFLSLTRYGGPEERYGSAEPLAALAGLAAVTERVRLGTLVLSAGFRHPAILAKAAATIDLLSGGRLDLGVGAGWYEDEYRAFGYRFRTIGERFEVLEETVEVLTLLFGEVEPATWEGAHYRLEEAYCRPRPVQSPRPPLWVGARAARGCCGSSLAGPTDGTRCGRGRPKPTRSVSVLSGKRASGRGVTPARFGDRWGCTRWSGRTSATWWPGTGPSSDGRPAARSTESCSRIGVETNSSVPRNGCGSGWLRSPRSVSRR